MENIKNLAITLQRTIENANNISSYLHAVHYDCKDGCEEEKRVYSNKEQLVNEFKQLQSNGFTIDRETQMFIATNAPDVFGLINIQDSEAIRCMLKKWGETAIHKRKVMEYINIKNIKNFDKDLIIEALCGLGVGSIFNKEKNEIEKINEIVKMPAFKELTDEDKIHILKHNIHMLSYFESNTYQFQEAALKNEENNYDLIKLIYFPKEVVMLPDILVLVINNNDEFNLQKDLLHRIISKYNPEELNYIVEKVYFNSIDLGMNFFPFYSYFKSPDNIESYKKIYDHLINQKSSTSEKEKSKKFTEKEIDFISQAKFIPDFDKNSFVDAIVIMPEILHSKNFIDSLSCKYSCEEYKSIISQAASQNREVLKAGVDFSINNYIDKDVLISIIKKYPSYIEYIREPSKHLCEIAFKGDPTLFKKIYNYVSIETLVEAVYFDPSNICYAGSKGIYSRELYNLALSVINSGKKKVSSYTIDICCAYLDGIEEIEENQKSIVEHIKKI